MVSLVSMSSLVVARFRSYYSVFIPGIPSSFLEFRLLCYSVVSLVSMSSLVVAFVPIIASSFLVFRLLLCYSVVSFVSMSSLVVARLLSYYSVFIPGIPSSSLLLCGLSC